MRDDSHKWDVPQNFSAPLAGPGVTISRIIPDRQTLISAPDILARTPGAAGWPDRAAGDSYTLCLRRDRVLEVNGPARTDGWDGQQAVSDITDGLTIFEITGPRAMELIRRGAEISDALPSRSAVRQAFGLEVILCRRQDALRLHVARTEAQALRKQLADHITLM
ncbi:hypothetical protein [Pseudodonghicola xiamenensis]|uniref:Uncharacterized protein n=1 Tax=Pseudodonghicola xiamenensis TaxID=337702 RepID=A0A8J3MCL8_9RHOB|nr:hypothetical protein [Pseudodonghicola xiamenensis]GHG92313.1 hypothetical protein GCM10010961_24230 [Pseudodonghicola xiamenensis]